MLLKVRKEYLLVITIDTEGLQSRAGKQSAARLDKYSCSVMHYMIYPLDSIDIYSERYPFRIPMIPGLLCQTYKDNLF